MLALLGSLFGGVLSLIPEFFKVYQDKRDKAHELALMEKQATAHKEEAVLTADYKYDIEALKVSVDQTRTGIKIVDTLNGLVRPIITFSFFITYILIKLGLYLNLPDNAPFFLIAETIWTENDWAIFSGIITFYFGNRAIKRLS